MIPFFKELRWIHYTLLVLAALVAAILLGFLLWVLVGAFVSSSSANASVVLAAFLNTCKVMLLSLLFVFPIGIGAASVFTEGRMSQRLRHFFLRSFDILSAVPTLLYGLVGFGLLLRFESLTLVPACITLALILLPRVIGSTMRTLQCVSRQVRQSSIAAGATRLHTWAFAVIPKVWSGLAGVALSAAGFIFSEATVLYLFFLATGSPHLNTLGALVLTDTLSTPDPGTALFAAALMLLFALFLSLAANHLAVQAGRRAS